jgi:hypothetical protein
VLYVFRELVLARLRIPMAELSQFITPEPYPEKTNGKILANPNAGHSGWYVLEEVQPEILTTKGLSNMLRDATLGTLNTTINVTNATVQATAHATNAAMSTLRGGSEHGDALGTSSTGKMSNTSHGKSAHSSGKATTSAAATPAAPTPAAPAAGKKNKNKHAVLSSDQPRDDVVAPQMRIRIRIVEEKDDQPDQA